MNGQHGEHSASRREAHSVAWTGGEARHDRSDDGNETTGHEQRHEQARPRLKRPLTDREWAMVEAVGRHRVLTGLQLQRLFFPISDGVSRAGALRRGPSL